MTARAALAPLLVAALLLGGRVAVAHPIEPLVAGSPMPVAEGAFAVDAGYSARREEGATEQAVPLSIAAGVGGRAELTVAAEIDATQGRVGPLAVGGQLLLLMEGHRGVDLALGGSFSSERAAVGTLLVGRTVLPGLYLQGGAAFAATSAAPPAPAAGGASLRVARHGTAAAAAPGTEALQASVAAQWAARPRWLATLEAQWAHSFRGGADDDEVILVPELIHLVRINHLALKLGAPIGLVGGTQLGVLAQLAWQG